MMSEPSASTVVAADDVPGSAEGFTCEASVPSDPKPCPSELISTPVDPGPASLPSCVWSIGLVIISNGFL